MYDNEILMKNKLDIMIESASIEDLGYNNEMGDLDLQYALEGVMTISSDMEYPLPSIPILVQESQYGGQIYLVEYDMVAKVMESYDMENEREALEELARANDISYDDLYLVIESKEYFEDIVNEAKAKGGSNLKGKKVNNVIKSIEDLKKQGIKVAKKAKPKKKSKKKGKKKNLLGIEVQKSTTKKSAVIQDQHGRNKQISASEKTRERKYKF